MSRAIALTRTAFAQVRIDEAELLRRVLVIACAAALILAGRPLPF